MYNCLFCRIYDDKTQPLHPEDMVLAESEFFFLKPALGPFVVGYCLIVAKDHHRTIAEMPARVFADLTTFHKRSATLLHASTGSPVVTFEHGAACPGERAGSCIDHAHLHLVPTVARLSIDLPGARHYAGVSFQDIPSLTGSEPYLFCDAGGCKELWAGARDLPSQYLRRCLAESLGLDGQWDWREFPFRDRIQSFCEGLSRAGVSTGGLKKSA